MDCPNCGTYNPEDRETCWRCDKPLPKRQPAKRRDPQRAARTWLYIAVAIFAIVSLAQMCGLRAPGTETPEGQSPTGYRAPAPAVVVVMASPWAA